jgi:hypothetical protein
MKACLVAALTLLASPVSAAAVYEQSGTLVNNTASDRVLDLGVVFFQKSFDQPNKSVVSYFTFDRAPTYLQAQEAGYHIWHVFDLDTGAFIEGQDSLTPGTYRLEADGNNALLRFDAEKNRYAEGYVSSSGRTYRAVEYRYFVSGSSGLSVLLGAGENIGYSYRIVDYDPVPEPATWAMMIAGFGLLGATVRASSQRARVLSI